MNTKPAYCPTFSRWHVYDTITSLIYGEPVGMVEQGRDVDGLINEWHSIFTLGGLVATLPWLVHPIISNRLLKRFFMPSKGNSKGSGHVMTVSDFKIGFPSLRYEKGIRLKPL